MKKLKKIESLMKSKDLAVAAKEKELAALDNPKNVDLSKYDSSMTVAEINKSISKQREVFVRELSNLKNELKELKDDFESRELSLFIKRSGYTISEATGLLKEAFDTTRGI